MSFETWTGQSVDRNLSNSVDSSGLAFQCWRRFKEAFSPRIIQKAVLETEGRVDTIFDPFCGSGTTPLSAQFLGAKGVAVEVNPYLADLAEAKLATYDVLDIVRNKHLVSHMVSSVGERSECAFLNAPKTFVEPGVKDRYIFNAAVAQRISKYRSAIERIENLEVQRLFRVLLASTLIPVSNVVVSGKGRRYRRGWTERSTAPSEVDKNFNSLVDKAIFDVSRFQNRASLEYDLHRGDVRAIGANVGHFDLVVTSPPYPNSFDYTDVYNVELWALGYLSSKEDNHSLRCKTLRSHVQIKRDLSFVETESACLRATLEELHNREHLMWDKNIPNMVASYFDDMRKVLEDIKVNLRDRGRIYMIVGDSRYSGANIPVATILAEIAGAMGYREIKREQFRSMRASPQQGGQPELAETLLVLEKP